MGRKMRFELTTSGTTIRRSDQLSYFRHRKLIYPVCRRLSTAYFKKGFPFAPNASAQLKNACFYAKMRSKNARRREMDFEKISINDNDFSRSKKAVLDNFVPSRPEKAKEEAARFRKIVDTVMKVPAGRETLMALAKQQPPRKFCFETFPDKAGCFAGGKILLNPNVSDDLLPATLVHEATHSLQDEHNPAKEIGRSAFTAESQLKLARAMEADAFAKEAMFVHQCGDYAPEIYDAEMKFQNKTLRCFDKAVKNGATQEEALRKTYLEFYKQPDTLRFYDDHYGKGIVKCADYAATCGRRNEFTMTVSDADVMKFCAYNGKPYIDEEDLQNPYVRGIEVGTRNKIQSALNDYAVATGSKRDTSLLTMAPISTYELRLERDEEARQRQERVEQRKNTSFMERLRQQQKQNGQRNQTVFEPGVRWSGRDGNPR